MLYSFVLANLPGLTEDGGSSDARRFPRPPRKRRARETGLEGIIVSMTPNPIPRETVLTEWVTVGTAAHVAGVCRSRVYALIAEGRLRVATFDGITVLWRADVEAYGKRAGVYKVTPARR